MASDVVTFMIRKTKIIVKSVNQTEVLIIVEHRPFRRKPHRRVCRAIYEDGLQRAEDSVFFWDTDGPMVPEGWYETADYGSSNMVDDIVIGWQPLPDPWET